MARMRGPDYGSMLRAIYEPKLQRQTDQENIKLKQKGLQEQIRANKAQEAISLQQQENQRAIQGEYATRAANRFKSEGDARSHDILMQEGRFGQQTKTQGLQFGHDLNMLNERFRGEGGLIDRRFAGQKALKGMDQSYDRWKTTTGREFEAGMQDERLQSTENIALMNDVTKRYGIDVSADVARDGYVSQENIAKLREAGMDERLIKTLDTKTQMQQASFDHALEVQGRGFGQEKAMFTLGSQDRHGLLDKQLASREGIEANKDATTRYGVDKSLEGTKYVADTGAESRETVAKIGSSTQLKVTDKQTNSAESIAKMRELGATARTAMTTKNAKSIAELPYKTGPIDEGTRKLYTDLGIDLDPDAKITQRAADALFASGVTETMTRDKMGIAMNAEVKKIMKTGPEVPLQDPEGVAADQLNDASVDESQVADTYISYLDTLDREGFKVNQNDPSVWSKAMNSFGSYGDKKYGNNLIGELGKMYSGLGQSGMQSYWPGTNTKVSGAKERLKMKLTQLYQARGDNEEKIELELRKLEDGWESHSAWEFWEY